MREFRSTTLVRYFLRCSGVAAFSLVVVPAIVAALTVAAAAADPAKIGVVLPNTGTFVVGGQGTIRGLELYLNLLYVSAQLTWWHTLTSTMVVESSQLIAH